MTKKNKRVQGVLAEFDNPADLLKAAAELRDSGYKRFDCHSPFPIHGMDSAMGIGPSKLGWLVALGGVIGFACAIIMQWWMSAVDYPVVISGKPAFSFQAFVPITFELTILFSAFATVLGMLMMNWLPRFNHPVFESEHFQKVTDDGFFVSIDATDPEFHPSKTGKYLESIGGKNVETLESV